MSELTERLRTGRTVHEREQMVIDDLRHRGLAAPQVLNKRNGMPAGAVYVGRPSKWGNPFQIGRDGDRAEVIEKFTDHLLTSHLLGEIGELRGRDLVCWCAPEACHADVLLRLANAVAAES